MATDGDRILEELRSADELTLRFNPWGFGGRLEPAASARYLSELLAYAALREGVPEDVRLNFERVRNVFLHGLLDYDLFSAAYDLGHLALEGALRARFVDFYAGQIPIFRDGLSGRLAAASFSDYFEATRPRKGHRLQLDENSGETLPRGYGTLYQWARRRGLLVGQRNVGLFSSIVRRRNYVAHPEHHKVDMPPQVFQFLADVAEIINRLWGYDTDGGRLFPGPVRRRPRAAALSPDRKASVTFPSLLSLRAEPDGHGWTFALFLAADGEELVGRDWESPGHQRFVCSAELEMTRYPAELLFGPGSLEDLLAGLDAFDDQEHTDTVSFLDREFYVRVGVGGRPEFPRSTAQVAQLELSDPQAVWYLVRADFPRDAWTYIRDRDDERAAEFTHANVVTRFDGDLKVRDHVSANIGV